LCALSALCALVNLRCGSPSSNLFQSGGPLPVGGASGIANSGGTAGSSSSSSSSSGGASQSGGQSSNAGTSAGVGADGTGAGAGGAGNAGSAGSGVAGTGAGAAGSAGAVGDGGAATAGSANAGSGGTAGASDGGGATSGSGGANAGSGGGCGALTATFTPRAPVVEFLIDRSSTMFASGYWAPVRTSVLSVINALQSQVQFGVAAYTGIVGQTCPLDLTNLGSPALNDYAALNAAYSALDTAGLKTESPTAAALAALASTLSSAGPSVTNGAAKYVFLITDGGQDFCDDENSACGSDAAVYEMQVLKMAGVTSKTFGIKGSLGLTNGDLQDFENAGAGAAVGGNSTTIYNTCHGSVGWTALATSLSRGTNQALGTYQANGASTPSVLLDTTSTDSMNQALLSAAASIRSCTFDVTGSSIDLANAAQGSVQIDGTELPFNAANGWHMTSPTVLELVGSTCAKWQAPTSQQISFDFPCSSLE